MYCIEEYKYPFFVCANGDVYGSNLKKVGSKTGNGYLRTTTVAKDGSRVSVLIHRMVAKVFVDNPDNKPFVNHKDGVKDNNHPSNLEWCTSSENSKHAYDIGLKTVPNNVGENHSQSKLTEADIIEIRSMFARGINQFYIAKKFKVHQAHVSRIVNNKIWTNVL